jgi:hypothetical protein
MLVYRCQWRTRISRPHRWCHVGQGVRRCRVPREGQAGALGRHAQCHEPLLLLFSDVFPMIYTGMKHMKMFPMVR